MHLLIRVALFVVCAMLAGAFIIQMYHPTAKSYVAAYDVLWTTQNDVLTNASTGDVIFLSGTTHGEKCCKVTIDCIFSHIAFVVRDKESVWIWECDVGQRQKEGTRAMPLAHKLKHFKGELIAGWKPLLRGHPPYTAVMNTIQKQLKYKMDMLMLPWFVSWWPTLHRILKKKEKTFCSALVAELSQEVGIMKKSRLTASHAPTDWFYNKIDLEPGVVYGPTYFFYRHHKNYEDEDEDEAEGGEKTVRSTHILW